MVQFLGLPSDVDVQFCRSAPRKSSVIAEAKISCGAKIVESHSLVIGLALPSASGLQRR
jgi:hypothetical protein